MPKPMPKKDEDKGKFMARCMNAEMMMDEYPDDDDRQAACELQWKDEKKSAAMDGQVERRVYFGAALELRKKPDAGGNILAGIASPFGKESEDMGFREIMQRGAFKEALKDSDVIALFNHDPNFVLGRESANTLRVHEGKEGLMAEIDIPDTPLIRDLVVAPVERRDIQGMSIGFIVNKDQVEEHDDGSFTRTILEVKRLIDVSVVTFPAYPDTTIAVRSINEFKAKKRNGTFVPPPDDPLTIAAAEERGRCLNLKQKTMEV